MSDGVIVCAGDNKHLFLAEADIVLSLGVSGFFAK